MVEVDIACTIFFMVTCYNGVADSKGVNLQVVFGTDTPSGDERLDWRFDRA